MSKYGYEVQLSDEDIQEFIEIYREEFNETLSFDEARAIATQFMHLFECLARPLPQPDVEILKDEAADSNVSDDPHPQ